MSIEPTFKSLYSTYYTNYLLADILDKDFKTTALKLLKQVEENVEKGKKTMCEHNGNISKYRKKKPKKGICSFKV